MRTLSLVLSSWVVISLTRSFPSKSTWDPVAVFILSVALSIWIWVGAALGHIGVVVGTLLVDKSPLVSVNCIRDSVTNSSSFGTVGTVHFA